MIRVLVTVLFCVVGVQRIAAAELDCVDLTNLDVESLAHYEFDARGEDASLTALDGSRTYTTGEVRIVVQPIFDLEKPAEDRWLYRQADRWHRDTRPSVIGQAILFRTGTPVQLATLRESERILRSKPYLYDARIVPRRVCGDRLDVDVVTRDVWTLTPDGDFSRLGGDSEYGFGILDTNVWGSGRMLAVSFSKETDRTGTSVEFADSNVLGSRVALDAFVEANTDGSRQVLDIGQPFYSLDATRAWGARTELDNQQQGLYLFGDKYAEFRQKLRQFGVSAGISAGERDAKTWRWLAGFTYEERTFSDVGGEVPPDPFPVDRTLSYPWVGFESIQDRFDTTVNVDRIDRTEDIHLGRQYSARLGYSSGALGGDGVGRLVLNSEYDDASRLGGRQLLLYGGSLDSYWNFDTNAVEEMIASLHADYRLPQSTHFTFAASIKTKYVANLTADMQLLGGAETGLRGYPSRYQAGDRSYRVSVEERYFPDIYIARVVRVGFAVFVDAGRTWFSDDPNDAGYGTLADIGFGLRFESTRTQRDRVLHLDFAFPLVDGPDVSGMEILLQVKDRL
jgi:outer membrane protein assembly factor BamA